MHKLDEKGDVNFFLIGLIVAVIFLIGTAAALFVTIGKYHDARDNVDTKVSAAVVKATDAQRDTLENEFAEREKQPFDDYQSAAKYGSIKVTYPKTWSAYVREVDGENPIDGYFYPKFVPATETKIKYALRLMLIDKQYADAIKNFDEAVKRGDLKATPITINNVTGTRFDGKLDQETTGSVVELPLRDKTVKIWTESVDFRDDFDNIILKNLTFVP